MSKKSSPLLLSPAIALMNKMAFSKKFVLLGIITFIAVCTTAYNLYFNLNQIIRNSETELKGLTLIHPVIKTIQLTQRHRGLSSGVLVGVNEMVQMRILKEHDVENQLAGLEAISPYNKQHESLKKIFAEWKLIRALGLQWTIDENFSTHTNLIDDLLNLESIIADDYGLTADPDLDVFYLAISSTTELLNALEQLGQIRAYGVGILGKKQVSNEQIIKINNLLALLSYTLKPLKISLEKAAYYNPELKPVLSKIYENVDTITNQVINVIHNDILNGEFSIQPVEFFNTTTQSIDNGYHELSHSLLPTAEKLILLKIQHHRNTLQITVGITLIFLLVLTYFMMAIYYATLGNIKILTQSLLGFLAGDMRGRIQLKTSDELSQIGNSFNIMADELTELISVRQASLDLLMKIANSVPGVVYQYRQRADGSACFPFASEAIREIYRVTPEDVRQDASKVFTVIHPADRAKVILSIKNSAQNLSLWHLEYRVQFDDRTVKWLLGNAMPEREPDGSTLWHGFITDITKRKENEVKLRMLSTAIEQSPTSVVITNFNSEIEYVNPCFTTVSGYSLNEVMGKNPRILQSGLTDKSTYQSMWKNLHNGQPWIGEFINKRKNGEFYNEESYISPVFDNDGSVSHYVAVKLDISGRKQAELQLQESEQRFRVIADAAPVLIWLADKDKHFYWFNKVWLDFTGHTMEQETGDGWTKGIHPDDLAYCLDIYTSHFDLRQPFHMEFRLKHHDGQYHWVDNTGVPCFDAKDEFTGYIGSCNDITKMRQAQNQLQESHDLLTDLCRQVPGMVYQYRLYPDGHSNLPFASEGIFDIYELSPEQVCLDATPIFSVLHPDDYDKFISSIQESATNQKPLQLEYRVNLPRKGIRWHFGLAKPEMLEDGSTLWHGFITDITEQIIDRNEASKTKEALESVLSSATEISIIVTDVDGLIRMFNRGAERMLGYTAKELIGKHTVSILHKQEETEQRGKELSEELKQSVTGFQIFVEKAIQFGQETREWTYVRKDQSTLIVSLVVTAIRNKNQQITGYLAIAEDITERKQAENQRDLLLKIIEDAPDFISTADMQSHLKYINTAGARLIGLTDNIDLADLTIKDLHPDWAAMRVLIEGIPKALQQGFWQGETALLHKDGHEIPVSELLLLHRDASGNPQHLSLIMRDITVHKQAEQALQQAKETAENLAQSKSDFLANMSHEIRTPMNAIIGLSHLALNKTTSPEIRDYLEKINRSSNSLLSILNDILDFSKLEAGRLTIDQNPFNLDEILDNINKLFSDSAEKKHLKFQIDVASDVPRHLIGDSLRLQQILINLLGNAIKFTEHGAVTLQIKAKLHTSVHAQLLFCVTDTGIGMSSEDCEKLFRPFSQADGSITRRFGGTGLGLAISHNLLQLMGGKFSVTSSLGKGSNFSFELTLGISTLPYQPPIETQQIEQTNIGSLLIGTHILIAEDNLINQQVIREYLNLSGVIVDIANNGKETVKLLEQSDFDAVLMDIHMPIMDGFEATKLIRNQPRFATLPVIALTAGVTKEEREKCLAAGMNDFISKPINPKKLLSTLVQHIKPRVHLIDTEIIDPSEVNPMTTSNQPFFDLHNLLEMLGNNRELAIRLLHTFMEDMKNVTEEINLLVAAGNLTSAKELVHRIKGASGNIGAVQLHSASEALEKELKNEQPAVNAFNTFQEVFNQTMAIIAGLHQPEELVPLSCGNKEALMHCSAELDILLQENDFISETLLNELKSNLASEQYDLFNQLRKLITELKYAQAREILKQLSN